MVGGGPRGADQRRFEDEILVHADAAYNLAARLTRGAPAAEDIVQDAFLRAFAGLARRTGADARAWVLAIVRNRAFDWLRARRRDAGAEVDDPAFWEGLEDEHTPDPEAALIRKSETAAVRALVDDLPPLLKEVVVLREFEDLSYRQIAEITGAPIGSVMSRLARARSRLATRWRTLAEAAP